RGAGGDCRGPVGRRGHNQALTKERQALLSGSRQCRLWPDSPDVAVTLTTDSRDSRRNIPRPTPAALSEHCTADQEGARGMGIGRDWSQRRPLTLWSWGHSAARRVGKKHSPNTLDSWASRGLLLPIPAYAFALYYLLCPSGTACCRLT